MIVRPTFRAEFSGMMGILNPAGFSTQNTVQTIEVYRKGNNWYARTIFLGKPYELPKLGAQATHGTMKDMVVNSFSKQVSPWLLFENGRPIDPLTVIEDVSGKFTIALPLHIAAPEQSAPGNQFITHCGKVVGAHQIRSKRGDQTPTCPPCREEWLRQRAQPRVTVK